MEGLQPTFYKFLSLGLFRTDRWAILFNIVGEFLDAVGLLLRF
jgi:hypothetical protein